MTPYSYRPNEDFENVGTTSPKSDSNTTTEQNPKTSTPAVTTPTKDNTPAATTQTAQVPMSKNAEPYNGLADDFVKGNAYNEHSEFVKIPTTTPSSTTTKAAPTTTKKVDDLTQEDNDRRKYYKEVMDLLTKKRDSLKPNAEDDERNRKRERTRAFISAIGDGISALARIGAAKGYASVPKQRPESLTDKWKERYDENQKRRKERETEYLNYTAKIAELADKNAEWRRKVDIDKADQARKDAELERKQALAQATAGKIAAERDKTDSMAAYYKAKEQAIIDGKPLETAEKEAKIALIKAQQKATEQKGNAAIINANKRGQGRGRGKSGSSDYTEKTITEDKTILVDNGFGKKEPKQVHNVRKEIITKGKGSGKPKGKGSGKPQGKGGNNYAAGLKLG